MKLIISPAKRMIVNTDDFEATELPQYLEKTRHILLAMRQLSYSELQTLWHTSDNLTQVNYDQLQKINLTKQLTPAVLSFTGIQYQYMTPDLLTVPALDYLQNNLRILSGFYGILKPFDGISPYRLEMQAKLAIDGKKNLYSFWGDQLYQAISSKHEPIVNLASKEYSKTISSFLQPQDQFITIVFGHFIDGKVKTLATLAKMARGEMVRFIAENQLQKIDDLKFFDSSHYEFSQRHSTDTQLVFIDRYK